MTNNSKEKPTPTNPRTYLINSVQLTDIMKYLMSRPYSWSSKTNEYAC